MEKSDINITPHGISIPDFDHPNEDGRHSEEIQEIITRIPSWIVRWGITVFFAVLLIAEIIAVLVRYPEMVEAPLTIESTSITAPAVIPIAGRITTVFVRKGQVVKKNQRLVEVQGIAEKPFTLRAAQAGRVSFAAIVQVGATLNTNQLVFQIHPVDEQYFGVLNIPNNSISKIKEGQDALVFFNNYSIEQYSPLKGKINFIADEPLKSNGGFIAKITFGEGVLSNKIHLKGWMRGYAKVVTEDVSLQHRIYKSIIQGIK